LFYTRDGAEWHQLPANARRISLVLKLFSDLTLSAVPGADTAGTFTDLLNFG
jgi:hypothetical protein